MSETFMGFRRADGRVGIRNYVVVISAMDNVNPVARRIAARVPGVVPICVAYGRGMVAQDAEQHDRVLLHYGAHPNVSAVLVVGLEPVTAKRFADAIAKSGKPVHWLAVQLAGGTAQSVERGVEIVQAMVRQAATEHRTETSVAELLVGLECGASDATSGLTANTVVGMTADWLVAQGGTVILSETEEIIGAEHLLAQRAATPQVATQLLQAVADAEAQARFQGVQIVPLGHDNLAGGLSTMEEKSMGAVRKGGTSPLREVIGYGQQPSQRGLVFMDAPAPGVENIAALAASGAQLILFSTGLCNPVGHPLVPTLKLTGNPETALSMADNIDVDVGGIIRGDCTMAEASERLKAEMHEVAEGRLTCAERHGDLEISISRVDVAFLRHRAQGRTL